MAVKVKEFESARDKHDWHRWTDGSAWQAFKGVDFDCTPDGFRSCLYQHARRKGFSVRVSMEGDTVTFQFSRRKKTAKRK